MSSKTMKISYQTIMGFDFSQLIQKLTNTPTSNHKASHIRRIVKQVQAAREKIQDEYKREILEVFSMRDDAGNIVKPEGEPNGFIPKDELMSEFTEAQESFGQRHAEINWTPIKSDTLSDMRVSAKELEVLGELYDDSEGGPGVPEFGQDHTGNVQSLR